MRPTSASICLGLALLGGCCAEQAHGTRDALTVELRPDQLHDERWFVVGPDGRRVLAPGAQFQPAYVLRGDLDDRAPPVLAAAHLRVADGEVLVGPDLAVEFHDGRVWIGFPAGRDVPYVDAAGRVVRVDRDQLFDVGGAFTASDLPDRSRRRSLQQVIEDPRRFREVD